jgi:putative glutamine amidotransferase
MLHEAYFNALYDAGCMPVAMARTTDPDRIAAYVDTFDGFFFAGGVDVDPARYGESITGEGVEIDESRDAFELAFFPAAFASGKPILGICRGIQVINVAMGGTLYQDIPGHRQSTPAEQFAQPVTLQRDTRLYGICGAERLLVNSCHHQAIKDVAPGLRVTARADDGTIEAVEATEHPYLVAVQWHPERFYREDAAACAIFDSFARVCGKG